MKPLSLLSAGALLFLLSIHLCSQPVLIVNGTYSGDQLWEADTVKVTGDVTVTTTLTIRAGTYVEFQGFYKLTADALYALGNRNDTIVFTMNDTTGFSNTASVQGGWAGLNLKTATMEYCRIGYIKMTGTTFWGFAVVIQGKMNCDNLISHCVFSPNMTTRGTLAFIGDGRITNSTISHNNGYAISCFTNGTNLDIDSCTISYHKVGIDFDKCHGRISNSVIEYNTSRGVQCVNEMDPQPINNNLIQYNGTGMHLDCYTSYNVISNVVRYNDLGISVSYNSGENKLTGNIIYGNKLGIKLVAVTCRLINNLIFNNSSENGKGAAIRIDYSNATLINNTIVNNTAKYGAGIYFYQHGPGEVILINCILRNNQNEIGKQLYACNDNGQITFPGKIIFSDIEGIVQADITGGFSNNMDLNPRFVNPAWSDYHLARRSSCINAGTPDTTGLNLPATDLDGKRRIVYRRIDMGAYEFRRICRFFHRRRQVPVFPGDLTNAL